MIIRPAKDTDTEKLMTLAAKAGQGLTTLPKNEAGWQERIEDSLTSFARPADSLSAETYLLVLEETDGTLSGVSAIYTNLGQGQPFYSYRLSKHAARAPEIGVSCEATVLSLVNDFHGYAEIGTLFLDPAMRGGGRGTLLSFSRFMLMASMRERFGPQVMAEMRGWTDADGRSPFWEAVGRKFFKLDFAEADMRSGVSNRFIADLMPKVPIYTELLPDEAQRVIGLTHDKTRPARALLEKQGFRFRNQVDVFDAGPCLEADLENIPLIRGARACTAGDLSDEDLAASALIARADDDLRVVQAAIGREDLTAALGAAPDTPLIYSPL
ncbi:arginine N-succinyltransferase [Kordiimonas lipolytica]|uniref:Arginine N-succinyltransferase n=1 Tax=Kordiimonas lipolytica TaxID=1662421 RepID=A0ABV8U8Y4_9PROT|nr:arginine N-succinyltransferase [Kordiimonas lipolytica]